MASVSYFAYGSNMLTERLQARCKSAKARCLGLADGHKLAFNKKSQDGSGKATIPPDEASRVYGIVFDINETELPALDKAEGAGIGYDRIDDFQVHIVGRREPLSVVTYIANVASIDPDLKPYDWYLKLIVAGARQHKLPPQYIEAIKTTLSIPDPKPNRKSRLEALTLLGEVSE
ncbi:MAG: gamma-glutamylcyclotransferase family protein [Parvibaculaceae bacterium]